MKQILLVLAISLTALTTQAQTRTFNTEVRLNNLAKNTDNEKILVINDDDKISAIDKSELISDSTPQTLVIEGQTLSISDGNAVTLPSPQIEETPQTLILDGQDLTISGGNTITLPDAGGSSGGVTNASDVPWVDVPSFTENFPAGTAVGRIKNVNGVIYYEFIARFSAPTGPEPEIFFHLPSEVIGENVNLFVPDTFTGGSRDARLVTGLFKSGFSSISLRNNSDFEEGFYQGEVIRFIGSFLSVN